MTTQLIHNCIGKMALELNRADLEITREFQNFNLTAEERELLYKIRDNFTKIRSMLSNTQTMLS